MKEIKAYIFLFFSLHLFSSCLAHRWLKISRISYSYRISNPKVCERFRWLDKKQKNVCKRNIDMMESIRLGAMESIEECQKQFRSRRWNCTMREGRHMFGKALNFATKEAAFVYALSSAGVAYSITRTCSSGVLETCGCDKSNMHNEPITRRMITSQQLHRESRHGRQQRSKGKVDLKWSGCNDNVAYGSAMARVFIDVKEKVRGKLAAQAFANLHNNNAGRKAVENSVQIQCKCHGVSGSCELKTCWRAMSSFQKIASTLTKKFDSAIHVHHRRLAGSRREFVAKKRLSKKPKEEDLIYLHPSPDFCEVNKDYASLGTHLRACNITSDSFDGCEEMCCGRGFFTRTSVVTERCHCKFQWCCHVRCQTCQFEKKEYFCK